MSDMTITYGTNIKPLSKALRSAMCLEAILLGMRAEKQTRFPFVAMIGLFGTLDQCKGLVARHLKVLAPQERRSNADSVGGAQHWFDAGVVGIVERDGMWCIHV